jgi:acyl-CoA thioesterase YciA
MKDATKPQGHLVIQIVAMPADTNMNGDIFGGWLVSHMDMGAAIAARRRAGSRVVTVGIDGLSFIKPVYVGDTVSCYANLIKVGHTSLQFMIEVWTLSIQDEEAKKVAHGMFTFVAIDEQRRAHPVDRK